MKLLYKVEHFLEEIDSYRDKLLFLFIKPYWPRKVIPNHITYIRVIIGIVLFVLLFFFGIQNKSLILWLFIIGVITDLVDGPVARGIDKVTEFGAMLDSTSDRILVFPIAFYSLLKYQQLLLVILIIVEIINGIASLYYKSKDIYLESNIFGKIKMVLFCVVFVVILIVWPNKPSQFFIYMLWLTIPFSFLSIFSRILKLVKNKKVELPKFKNL